jgi:starch-binding outer membrane protein, SusD/RagB family
LIEKKKMKRYIIKTGLCCLLALGFASCDDKLDIQPEQSIDMADALNSPQGVESAVVGLYANLGHATLYGTNLVLLPDLQGSEGYIRWDGTFQGYREVSQKTMTSINTEALRTWERAYSTINLANNILESLPVVTDAADKSRLEGEALLVRGMLYFELVRMYGLPFEAGAANAQLGVPLVLKATTTLEQGTTQTARATVAAVYDQVIADLAKAASLLPETTSKNVRATKFVAHAFLARVYMQQGNYAAALTQANTVINSGNYSLNSSVAAAFSNRNTRESIMEIQQNDQNNAGTSNDGLTTFYASLGGIGRGDVRVETDFQDLYETNDLRRADLLYEGTGRRAGRLRTGKYVDYGANIPLIRLAEMYLIRAEANFRLGNLLGADNPTADVNRIRRRAGASEKLLVTLDDILRERQLELAFEGHRIHDIKRTKGTTGTFAYNDPKLVYPIPKREMDANELLEQNDTY